MNQPVLPQQGDRIGYMLAGKVLNALVISASVGSNRNTNQKYIEEHRDWQAAGGRADTMPQPPQEVALSLVYIDPSLGVVVKLNGIPEATDERNTGWAPNTEVGYALPLPKSTSDAFLQMLHDPYLRDFVRDPKNQRALAEAMGYLEDGGDDSKRDPTEGASEVRTTATPTPTDMYKELEPGLIELSMQVAKMDARLPIDPVGTILSAIHLLKTSTEGVDAELQRIADEGARKVIPIAGTIGQAEIHREDPDPISTGPAPADPADSDQQEDFGPDWSSAKEREAGGDLVGAAGAASTAGSTEEAK